MRRSLSSTAATLPLLRVDSPHIPAFEDRYDEPPPPYASPTPSAEMARPGRPVAPHEQTEAQHTLDCNASLPATQFRAEVTMEAERIWNKDPFTRGTPLPIGGEVIDQACDIVTRNWIQEGIWQDAWNSGVVRGLWEHELPESSQAVVSQPACSFLPRNTQPSRHTDNHIHQESSASTPKFNREASRPYYRFISFLSRERRRMVESGFDVNACNINTKAYEKVKEMWMLWKIWDEDWGIVPGMRWRHEDRRETSVGPSTPPAENLISTQLVSSLRSNRTSSALPPALSVEPHSSSSTTTTARLSTELPPNTGQPQARGRKRKAEDLTQREESDNQAAPTALRRSKRLRAKRR